MLSWTSSFALRHSPGAQILTARGRRQLILAGVVAIAMGAVTGCVGGIIRDTLGHVPSVLPGHEIYVTASVLGACICVGLNALGVGRLLAMIAGFLVTFIVRGFASSAGRCPSSVSRRSASVGETCRKAQRKISSTAPRWSKKRQTSTAFDTRLRFASAIAHHRGESSDSDR
jgi:hypothetical protein